MINSPRNTQITINITLSIPAEQLLIEEQIEGYYSILFIYITYHAKWSQWIKSECFNELNLESCTWQHITATLRHVDLWDAMK